MAARSIPGNTPMAMDTPQVFLRSIGIAALLLGAVPACGRSNAATPPPAPSASVPPASVPPQAQTATAADIGKPAPDFTLDDLDGHAVHLADKRGSLVVLEWFNPSCPFVNKAHTKGSLKDAAARHVPAGVVWLGIDSSAPGKQGYEPDTIRAAVTRFGLTHPILRDETGAVGRAYGATNTPHMFVIDKTGTLVYAGAIDNSPDAEGESPSGGSLVNYVDAALDDLAAGRPVRTPRTKAYGCGVKYGS
jgi:peroxiredoxin